MVDVLVLGLSQMHLDAMRLLATGATDKAVGLRLKISDRTVRRLVRDLCDHFGVDGRLQLGVAIGQSGLVVLNLSRPVAPALEVAA